MRERNFCAPNKRGGAQLAALLIVIAGVDAAKAEGFYVDAGVVGSHLGTNGFAEKLPGLSVSDEKADDENLGWKVGGGYRIFPSLAVEVGYADFGDATAVTRYIGQNSRSSAYYPRISVSGPYAAFVGLLPVHRCDLFVKLGALRADTEVTTREVTTLKYHPNPGTYTSWIKSSADNIGLLLGMGVTYKFTDRYAVAIDLTHVPKVGDDDVTGQDELTSLSLTARYNF